MCVWVGSRLAGWLDGWMAGWLAGWMDGWVCVCVGERASARRTVNEQPTGCGSHQSQRVTSSTAMLPVEKKSACMCVCLLICQCAFAAHAHTRTRTQAAISPTPREGVLVDQEAFGGFTYDQNNGEALSGQ